MRSVLYIWFDTDFPSEIITGITSIRMSYENYDYDIIAKHGVRIEGWPDAVPFQNPSRIFSVTDLITVRDAWRAKTCRWAKMSCGDLTKFKKELEAKEAAGKGKKARKKRSDAGQKRKRAKTRGDEDNEEEDEEEPGEEGDEEEEHRQPSRTRRRLAYKS